MSAASTPKRGRGRPPGAKNKKTQERLAKMAKYKRLDPLENTLDLQEDAKADYDAARKDLEKMRRRWPSPNEDEAKAIAGQLLLIANLRVNALDASSRALPYVHSRLSSVEAKVDVTNHEAALDSLDD